MENQDFSRFTDAFNHAMLYEVGAFWNPDDPDVIAGNISTREQRRKVGYVNIKQDTGGETKYGIAQNKNPNVIVRDLDLNAAMRIYYEEYWLKSSCDRIDYPTHTMHFDSCVNHGISRGNQFLQMSVNVPSDGIIGSVTLGAVQKADQARVIEAIYGLRENFYRDIVKRKPSQKIFLEGWLRRISEVREYCLDKQRNKG
jgi:lysozyme family protein